MFLIISYFPFFSLSDASGSRLAVIDTDTSQQALKIHNLKYTLGFKIRNTLKYNYNVCIKYLLGMSCRLLVACDEMRKRRFIDKIDAKTSKTMKQATCDVNVVKV